MSKAGLKSSLLLIATVVVFGGSALKWLFWWNTNPYAAFFFGIVLVPIWIIALVIWLSITGIDFIINSKREEIEDSIEADYSLREEQIRKSMEDRAKQ